jgi:hypothetical protein
MRRREPAGVITTTSNASNLFIYLLNLSKYKSYNDEDDAYKHDKQVICDRRKEQNFQSHLKPNPLLYTQYTIYLYSTIYTLYFCIYLYTYTHIWKRLT